MVFTVIRPTKDTACDVCKQTIVYGLQVTSTCIAGRHSAHLECLNNLAKDALAGGK